MDVIFGILCISWKVLVLGNSCNIGQNVMIAGSAIIGNNVKIQNNVSVYDGVICEDDVFLGPSCVFTNVRNPRSEFPVKGNTSLRLCIVVQR